MGGAHSRRRSSIGGGGDGSGGAAAPDAPWICLSCAADVQQADMSQGRMRCPRCYSAVHDEADEKQEQQQQQQQQEAERTDGLFVVKSAVWTPVLETLPDDEREQREEFLLDKYVRRYVAKRRTLVARRGDVHQLGHVDFRIVAMHPPRGVIDATTRLTVQLPPLSVLPEIRRVHILPAQATLRQCGVDQVCEQTLGPYLREKERLICDGDVFVVRGVQFKVVNCHPRSGRVTANTLVVSDGEPLPDLTRVHLLPIYESLPNREKDISANEVFSKYLAPFFLGWTRLLELGQELQIDGVNFKVVGAEPQRGLMTMETTIYSHGEPLRDEDIRRQQLHDDEELARRLQMEESGGIPAGRIAIIDQRRDSEMYRQRLRDVINGLPEGNQLRIIMQQLHDQFAMNPGHFARMSRGLGNAPTHILLQFERILNQSEESNVHGAEDAQINHLPTRFFSSAQNQNMGEEHKTCRICLCEYDDGEELRTLPCFHSYHKQCIDTWLRQNGICPICKHPIA